MARERQDFDDHEDSKSNYATVLAAETLRPKSSHREESDKGEEKISLFWRVFGGTILSIVALVVVTFYNQLVTTLGDLRRDINQLQEARADLLKKDDFNNRLTAIWAGLKELQTATNSLAALNERAKVLGQQMDKQNRASEDEHKEIQRKFDEQIRSLTDDRKELNHTVQAMAERLAALEGRQSAASGKSASFFPVNPLPKLKKN